MHNLEISFFTQQRDNDSLIKQFGPMYIDFYELPPYSGRKSENFDKKFDENIECVHGYAYSSGK